jgi:ketosteroid isomerase-like protein
MRWRQKGGDTMDAKTTVRRGIELWNAHDRDAWVALCDDSFTFVDQTGRQLTGREELGKGLYDLWTDAYPDNELKDPVVFGEGELVCFQGRFVGSHTGIFRAAGMELPPTGKPVDAPFVYIVEVRDGKMTRAWHYYDRLLAFEQEGIVSLDKLFAELQSA